jgi:hypothetical protein
MSEIDNVRLKSPTHERAPGTGEGNQAFKPEVTDTIRAALKDILNDGKVDAGEIEKVINKIIDSQPHELAPGAPPAGGAPGAGGAPDAGCAPGAGSAPGAGGAPAPASDGAGTPPPVTPENADAIIAQSKQVVANALGKNVADLTAQDIMTAFKELFDGMTPEQKQAMKAKFGDFETNLDAAVQTAVALGADAGGAGGADFVGRGGGGGQQGGGGATDKAGSGQGGGGAADQAGGGQSTDPGGAPAPAADGTGTPPAPGTPATPTPASDGAGAPPPVTPENADAIIAQSKQMVADALGKNVADLTPQDIISAFKPLFDAMTPAMKQAMKDKFGDYETNLDAAVQTAAALGAGAGGAGNAGGGAPAADGVPAAGGEGGAPNAGDAPAPAGDNAGGAPAPAKDAADTGGGADTNSALDDGFTEKEVANAKQHLADDLNKDPEELTAQDVMSQNKELFDTLPDDVKQGLKDRVGDYETDVDAALKAAVVLKDTNAGGTGIAKGSNDKSIDNLEKDDKGVFARKGTEGAALINYINDGARPGKPTDVPPNQET